MSNLWTVPRLDFWRIAVSRGRSPRIPGGPPKCLRPGGLETPFPALSDKYFCEKRFGKLIVISRLFSRLFYRWLEMHGRLLSAKDHAQMQYSSIQPETLGNGFLFAVFLVQTLTFPQIQVKYFVSLFIWRK